MSNTRGTSWQDEAHAVIRDIQQHVLRISISNLPSSEKCVYFNMTTLERKDFCMELTGAGFRIVGEKYDSTEKRGKYEVFETPYSMLDSLSPAYRDSFGEELFHKLSELKRKRDCEYAEQQEAETVKEEEEEEQEEEKGER